MNIKELIKKLAKSKRIQGIAITAIAAAVNYIKTTIMPELTAHYGNVITIATALVQAAGLSWATYGSWVASGPLRDIVKAVKDVEKKPSFDGTSGEL